MGIPTKIIILVAGLIVVVSSGYGLFFSELNSQTNTSDANTKENVGSIDTLPPLITTVTGDMIGDAGSTVTITTTFFDNVGVISAKLYYRPATAVAWSSKSILEGLADIVLPPNSNERWYYYITIDDAAGNGPIGDPSADGTLYYIIEVKSDSQKSPDNTTNGNDDINTQNYSRYVFIELGTKIVCSECPKISNILNDIYKSGDYPFYYVSLPQDNPKALSRINDYDIWGYPTVYIDGGYVTLVGSNIRKTDFEKNITIAAERDTPKIVIDTTAQWDNQTNSITIRIKVENHEELNYQGRLRVYVTELISTKWHAGTPIHFSFLDFLVNEDVQIPAKKNLSFTKTLSASELDPENLMLFSVLFNKEKQTKFSQSPDKNPFEAHFVDAVSATRVIEGGNLPPEIVIQNPSVKYFHRFGKAIRKTLTGNTIVIGRTNIIASVHDDSQIEKVEFYINNKLVATVTQGPYEWIWHKFSFGKKTITIKAYDDSGKQSTASIPVLAFML